MVTSENCQTIIFTLIYSTPNSAQNNKVYKIKVIIRYLLSYRCKIQHIHHRYPKRNASILTDFFIFRFFHIVKHIK